MIGKNLEEKLKVLAIDSNRISEIKNLVYKSFCEDEEKLENKGFKEKQIICLDQLVGMNRWDAHQFENWIDVLNSLHKMKNFDIYTKSEFEYVIENPPSTDNIPQVISLNGEFYIDGEGKHRLTIAKCLGLEKARVDIKYL
ncbi:hypothetical protein COK52_06780 [Bacillus thuringiensis]|nr:hypothetical protein COK52_06780 [Bacillus thuringiensis]